jgi:sigma-B regulation protein RsbU (phosphoserine phosphatase)
MIDEQAKAALDLFEADSALEAVPVQDENSVLGVVSRKINDNFSISAMYRVYQRDLKGFLIPFRETLDASSDIARIVDVNLKIDQGKFPAWFMVQHKQQFFGVVSLQQMLEYINMLRSQDIHTAGEIQKYLLNKSRARIEDERFKFLLYNRMAHETGGDFYHAYKSGADSFLVACFDVAGKNLAGSLTTMALGSCLATLEICTHSLGEKTTNLINTLIKAITPTGLFVTAVFFYIDFDAKTVCIHNCGFSPVMVFTPRDSRIGYRLLAPALPPLGIEENLDTDKGEKIPISGGLRICAWSDGLTEMSNILGERYEEERIKEFLKKTHHSGLEDMQKMLEGEIDGWIGDASPADDITLADIRFS